MNRRRFLAALVGVPFLPSALSALPASFGNRFIGVDCYRPLRLPPQLVQRKIMGRIRITEELMNDCAGPFSTAAALELQALCADLARREFQGT